MHLAEWVDSCADLGIIIDAREAMQAVNAYRELKGQQPQPAMDSGGVREEFSHEAFVNAVVEWIVSDDQVSSELLLVMRLHNTYYVLWDHVLF